MSHAFDRSASPDKALATQQIVTFKVDGRHFGVDVGAVREIKGWQQTTPLPNAAPHVLGVINLRGAIIAVYDLRRRLDLGSSALTRSSVVIVVDLGDRLAGILADAVSDILNVTSEELRPAPDVAGNSADLLQALVVKGDDVIALLHLAAIVRE